MNKRLIRWYRARKCPRMRKLIGAQTPNFSLVLQKASEFDSVAREAYQALRCYNHGWQIEIAANVLATLCSAYSQSWADYVNSLKRTLPTVPISPASLMVSHVTQTAHVRIILLPSSLIHTPEKHNAQIVYILRTWKKITKSSSKNIMPGELLSGHNLSSVKYNDTCHGHAMEYIIYLSSRILDCTDVRFVRNANHKIFHRPLPFAPGSFPGAMATQILPSVGARSPNVK